MRLARHLLNLSLAVGNVTRAELNRIFSGDTIKIGFPVTIGYLPVAQLTPALKPVAIDGKPYTDRGYLLAQAR